MARDREAPEEAGFLADIIAHPADNAPRLIYADWLEEHGDEAGRARAEFIREQIRLANRGNYSPRANELYWTYHKQWEKDFPPRAVGMYVGYRRGFLEDI